MQTYNIKALPLCAMEMDKSAFTYRFNYGKKITVPIVTWLVQGAGQNILVDTGADAELATAFRGIPATRIMSFEQALASEGLLPEDINMVIQTHLHWDHCANTQKCRNAKVIVQAEELEFARSPHPVAGTSYKQELLSGIDFVTVTGQHQLLPGIELIPTPGHTPGGMSVAIQTAAGKAVITGFCCINENFATPAGAPEEARKITPVMAPGINTNAIEGFESVKRIKELADLIIANHDPQYLQAQQVV